MLKVEKVTGGYHNLPVLQEVSFEVGAGELVGLIGLNGAGKSTTIKEIIGLLTPYEGSISLNSRRLSEDKLAYRQDLGLIPETPSLYEELTLREHIELVGLAYGLTAEQVWGQAEELLATFRLADKLDWFPTDFSKGMKQKVMIICALLSQPKLLIIDEPFLGLDPLAIEDLKALLVTAKANGVAILMSTHVLDTAEKICDRVVILHQGRIKAQGDLASLQEVYGDPSASLTDIYLGLTREVGV